MFKVVSVDLRHPVSSHGQLYVALSHARHFSSLKCIVVQHNVQQSRLVSHLVKGLSGSRACRAKYSQLRQEEMQVYCTGEECCLSLFLIYGKLVPMVHPCLFVQK